VYDALYELYTEMAVRTARAGVDMIRIVGDIAMQDRIIMGLRVESYVTHTIPPQNRT
jgi:hypothetical protein